MSSNLKPVNTKVYGDILNRNEALFGNALLKHGYRRIDLTKTQLNAFYDLFQRTVLAQFSEEELDVIYAEVHQKAAERLYEAALERTAGNFGAFSKSFFNS